MTRCTEIPAQATHRLACSHAIGGNYSYFDMPCEVLKTMPDGRLKVRVYGYITSGSDYDQSRIRYVSSRRVRVR